MSSVAQMAVAEKQPLVLLAEYNTPLECIHAAEKLRDAGYKDFDAHTPYPVHGMDKAMGLDDSKMGWLSLGGGITGLLVGIVMIFWMNGYDYPIIIGGKPADAVPSAVPILFELTILLTGFGTFFGLLGLCKLPRHHHPVFHSDRFATASDDKFWISVEASDPKFDLIKTKALLQSAGPSHLELIEEVP